MAYAVLASLFQTTEQILNFDPYFFPCSKNKIESVKESVVSLLTFLDDCSPNSSQTVNDILTKIRDVAYKAEDVFESVVANHFRRKYGIDFATLSQSNEEVTEMIKEIDLIAKEVGKLHDQGVADIRKLRISTNEGASRLSSSEPNSVEALHVELRIQILEQLVGGRSKLKVIPIVGMGGIGKTTLARSLFDDPISINHFDCHVWVTVSHECHFHDIVLRISNEIQVNVQAENNDLGEYLHRSLYGRRYLIVLDDAWDTRALDDLNRFFPDNNNGSRIMLTTRNSEVARYDRSVTSCHEMLLLNEDVSWNLFCREALGQKDCPYELVEIGKEIVKHCQGLPLAISVIGGILSKENMTREYWGYVAKNVKYVLVKNNEQCLGILSRSYNYLPHHLKSCFIYLGVFPEDARINVSMLIELWVAEGILKPSDSKSAEDVAKECLKNLIDRHLILVHTYGSNGKPKTCIIHDLLRDICIWEAQKEKFLNVLNGTIELNSEEANCHRRLSNHISFRDLNVKASRFELKKFRFIKSLMSVNRSFFSFGSSTELTFGSRLVKILINLDDFNEFPIEILDLVNLSYVRIGEVKKIPSSVSKLWNLQSLTTSLSSSEHLPDEIWEMPQLKHLRVYNFYWPDDLSNADEVRGTKLCVLKQLQTISTILNFRCTEDFIARMPNLRKLKIQYRKVSDSFDWSYYCLDNLVLLGELVSLNIYFQDCVSNETFLQNLAFPTSLRKLKLRGCAIPWDSLSIIGILPNLEVLKLEHGSCRGPVWAPNEGEFKKLKFLRIDRPAEGFIEWRADDIHFPSLKHLSLLVCKNLKAIPYGFAEIPTLEVIELVGCGSALCSSARDMLLEEQMLLGADNIRLEIKEAGELLRGDEDIKFKIEEAGESLWGDKDIKLKIEEV